MFSDNLVRLGKKSFQRSALIPVLEQYVETLTSSQIISAEEAKMEEKSVKDSLEEAHKLIKRKYFISKSGYISF